MAKKNKQRKKRVLKGVLAKAGALLMGLTPPAMSTVEAAAHATNPALKDLPIGDKAIIFGARLVNNLTAGLIGKDVFPTIQLSGQTGRHTVGNGWQDGATQHFPWLTTTASGLGLMLADFAIGKLTKSANRMAGVNITGSY
jgi:hypothetical protein